jgi:hypothetical protein
VTEGLILHAVNALAYLWLVSPSGIGTSHRYHLPLTGCERHAFSILHDLYRELSMFVFIPKDREGDVLFTAL